MTYIELINNFWSVRRINQMTAYEADFYFYLLKECNARKWVNPFELPSRNIELEIGISRKTICDLRNKLQQKGLIKFKGGNKNASSAIYEIIYVSHGNINGNIKESYVSTGNENGNINTVYVSEGNKKGNENGNINGNENGNINGNHIIKKENKKKKKEKPSLTLPFKGEKFLSVWNTLSESPKWKKKLPHALQLSLDKLGEFDEEFAIELMEYAISGNYQGVVYPNTKEKYKAWKNQKNKSEHPSTERINNKVYEQF